MYKLVVIINTCHIVIEDCSIASAWPTYCILQPHVCRWTVVVLTFFFFFSCGKHHQSPEWTILSHGYLLIQWEIVRPQVLLDSLHPRSSRTSWWSPPVLHRGSSDDTLAVASVSSGILSLPMGEQRKTPCLDNSRQVARLSVSPRHSARDGTIWFLTTFANTIIEGVDLEYISFGDCPALRAIQEDR